METTKKASAFERPPKKDLEALLADNISKDRIGDRYGVSRGTVSRWCIYYSLVRHQSRKPNREELEERLSRGMEVAEIAAEYGVGTTTISSLLTAFELTCAKNRAKNERDEQIMALLQTPRTIRELVELTGIKHKTLSSLICYKKAHGYGVDIVGTKKGKPVWGLVSRCEVYVKPKRDPNFDAFKALKPASYAPQFGIIVEHGIAARCV